MKKKLYRNMKKAVFCLQIKEAHHLAHKNSLLCCKFEQNDAFGKEIPRDMKIWNQAS